MMLSPETWKRVSLLFRSEVREQAATLLEEQCGNNLPFLEKLDEYELERFRFAALKISNGNLSKLTLAIDLAQQDWRDLLMAAGFGYDIYAHQSWLPEQARVSQTPG